MRPFARIAALVVALAAPAAEATFHTFRIEQVYSNADGSIQYVMLHEASNAGGQNLWAGHALMATAGTSTKTFAFSANLPSSATADRRVLVATAAFAAAAGIAADYTMPDRFVPTAGGQLDFAGVDAIALPPLPTDGTNAVDRSGASTPNAPRNFSGLAAMLIPAPVTAVEFYRSATDHYFISALAPDIDALDTGHFPGWTRTGQGFRVFATAAGNPGTNPVCRIYIPAPGDSHFFSASPAECSATLVKFPTLVFESPSVFAVALPDATTGACPAGTIPVYRVFDNRADPNHRYTTDRSVREAMLAKGYIAEGYGPDSVIMCAPSAAPGGAGGMYGYPQ
ncbi:MAG: hypothetical protein ABI886_11850 [Betaproteobacteria bacterium]